MSIFSWLYSTLCLGMLSVARRPADDRTLRVMTFNVRRPAERDGDNDWKHRRELLVHTIREQHPDVIGAQELYKHQGDYIVNELPQYAWFGEGRRGGDGDEHVGVFYRKDKLDVLESGNFWLSDTPDTPNTISWGLTIPRMVTCARFKVKADGRTFYVYNTHLPHREQHDAARLKSATVILNRMNSLPNDVPFVLLGDFNATPESAVYARFTDVLHDAWTSAPQREGPRLTFHRFTGSPDRCIDWILYRGLKANKVHTVTTQQGERCPSDHFPVVAELSWPDAHGLTQQPDATA